MTDKENHKTFKVTFLDENDEYGETYLFSETKEKAEECASYLFDTCYMFSATEA